jgi:hypothetical protein
MFCVYLKSVEREERGRLIRQQNKKIVAVCDEMMDYKTKKNKKKKKITCMHEQRYV